MTNQLLAELAMANKEIERLNNIINEIINMIKKDQENMLETPAQYILDKIQELKGDSSNGR